MGAGAQRLRRNFDLNDLGLLKGPSLKGATIIVETTRSLLDAQVAAFVVFDTISREVVVRATNFPFKLNSTYPIHGSALSGIEDGGKMVALQDLSVDMPKSVEATKFGVRALIATAVHGPDSSPIGALVAGETHPRKWDAGEKQRLTDLAYLITQEVTLHASFATLQLMSVDRPLVS